jgi:hypothetical protein
LATTLGTLLELLELLELPALPALLDLVASSTACLVLVRGSD